MDKIFQLFFTTKPTGHGTGLGLSLTYNKVKANGGTLVVNTFNTPEASQPGGELKVLTGKGSLRLPGDLSASNDMKPGASTTDAQGPMADRESGTEFIIQIPVV